MTDRPWVPDKLPPRRELTDREWAECTLESVFDQPGDVLDAESLAEALTYLDLLGHPDAAARLIRAADVLRRAARDFGAVRDDIVAVISDE